jgi:hypothetical protein
VHPGETIRLIGRVSTAYYSAMYLFLLIDSLTVVAYGFVANSDFQHMAVVVVVGVCLPVAAAAILLWMGWASIVLVSDRRIVTIAASWTARVSWQTPSATVSGIVMTRQRDWRGVAETYILRLRTGEEKRLDWLDFRVAV